MSRIENYRRRTLGLILGEAGYLIYETLHTKPGNLNQSITGKKLHMTKQICVGHLWYTLLYLCTVV